MARINVKKRMGLPGFLLVAGSFCVKPAMASDHADTALLKEIGRHDTRLTDFYAFTHHESLVLALAIDPSIKAGVADYVFPTDVTYRIFIDTDSKISYKNTDANITYGGTVKKPGKIKENTVFEVTFDQFNTPMLKVEGLKSGAKDRISIFTGLRDDPFIVSIRTGKNIAAIVLEMPLELITNESYSLGKSEKYDGKNGLLLWATSNIDTLNGNEQEFIGRAFRSTFPENDAMNTLHPRLHYSELDVAPDVMFLNLDSPVSFPNGRLLTDDVVDLIGDPRILVIDVPSPTENDVPFLHEFPYLAPPQ